MPIYQYCCEDCHRCFSYLWRTFASVGSEVLACPECGGTNLTRVTFGVCSTRSEIRRSEYRSSGLDELRVQAWAHRGPKETGRPMRELLTWLREHTCEETRRALAVLLYRERVTQEIIQDCTGYSDQETDTWVKQYQLKGIDGLESLADSPLEPVSEGDQGLQLPLFGDGQFRHGPEDIPTDREGCSVLISTAQASEPEVLDGSDTVAEPAAASAATVPSTLSHGLWQDNEPLDKSDHVEHQVSRSLVTASGWKLIGASRRGRFHAHDGRYREDDFAIDVEAGWHFVAVADGAGSARLSRVGARIAADAALAHVRQKLAQIDERMEEDASLLLESLEKSLEQAQQALKDEADHREVDVRELATTLLILAHRPTAENHCVATAQVGDGLLAAWSPTEGVIVLAGPEQGLFAGETQFLTHLTTSSELKARVHAESVPHDVQLFLAMTDGVADDFYPPTDELGRLIEHLPSLLSVDSAQAADLVQELLAYEKRGSFDDRTLVILAAHGFGLVER